MIARDVAASSERFGSMSWTAALRLLEAPREHQTLLRQTQLRVLCLLMIDEVEKPGFAELGVQILGETLARLGSLQRVAIKCCGLLVHVNIKLESSISLYCL